MFNRITLHYTAVSPMDGQMRYTIDGVPTDHVFSLVPAEAGVFTCFIHGAASGKLAEDCRILALCAPRGMAQTCTVHRILTDMVPQEEIPCQESISRLEEEDSHG